MKPIVQISLDLIDLKEALSTAVLAMRAGVDWLEAGFPFATNRLNFSKQKPYSDHSKLTL